MIQMILTILNYYWNLRAYKHSQPNSLAFPDPLFNNPTSPTITPPLDTITSPRFIKGYVSPRYVTTFPLLNTSNSAVVEDEAMLATFWN